MGESLICPECGKDLESNGRTAGQRFPCPCCGGQVVVPVLSRTVRQRTLERGKRLSTPRDKPLPKTSPRVWAWTGGLLLGALLLVLLVKWTHELRNRHVHYRAVDRLVAEADTSAEQKSYGVALGKVTAALAEAARIEPRDPAMIARLEARRDRLFVDEIKAQIPAIEQLSPEEQVGAYRELLPRMRDNPRLVRVEEAVRTRLDLANEQWAEADLKLAAESYKAGNAARAIDLCERAVGNTNTLGSERRRSLRVEADALASEIIPRRGLELGKIRGQYTYGSDASYEPLLRGELAEILRQRGYVIRPDSSFWESLWGQPIPFRMAVEVKESYAGPYPQSTCRMSYTRATLTLEQQQKGQAKNIWELVHNTRTRHPMFNLKPFRKEFHNPVVEKLFYDDAKLLFGESIHAKLQTIPEYRSLPGSAPAPNSSGG